MNSLDEKGKYTPPKPERSDKVLAVVRAMTGSIPFAGNAVNELMPLLFTAPLERRRLVWMDQIADALCELETSGGISLEQLQANESFISVLVQASQAAIRNHKREKLESLKHAVTNSAAGVAIDDDMQLLFIRFVDELTPSHMTLLRFFRDKEQEFEKAESYEQLFQSFGETHGEAGLTRDEFRLCSEELKARNLIRISANVEDFSGVGSNDYIVTEGSSAGPMLLVTEIGRKLIDFITEKKTTGAP